MSDSGQKIGYLSGFLVLLVLDLFALDDITTAGAWMPEIMVILCTLPALVTLGHRSLRTSGNRPPLEDAGKKGALGPPAPGVTSMGLQDSGV